MDILVTRKHPTPTQRLLINLLECVLHTAPSLLPEEGLLLAAWTNPRFADV